MMNNVPEIVEMKFGFDQVNLWDSKSRIWRKFLHSSHLTLFNIIPNLESKNAQITHN